MNQTHLEPLRQLKPSIASHYLLFSSVAITHPILTRESEGIRSGRPTSLLTFVTRARLSAVSYFLIFGSKDLLLQINGRPTYD